MSSFVRLIHTGQPTDFAIAAEIERAADASLIDLFGATDWPVTETAEERASLPGFLLVAEDAVAGVIGFAHVIEIDDLAHLEQVSVLPDHARQGHGRGLVEAAKVEARHRGYPRITLRTFVDVPWNAPFYASCGFTESTPQTPFHRHLVDVEASLHLDRFGPRIQMTADL